MRLYVAGIKGMVGSAIASKGRSQGMDVVGKSSQDLDFTDRPAVFRDLQESNPDFLIIAAAKVGGIGANSSMPVDFLSQNLQIQTNLMDAAHVAGIRSVLFLGSSCVYPKFASQPLSESALLTGALEPTNEPYAIAKIAGLKLIEAYRRQYGHHWISAMPTNLYGPGDNFNQETAHVLPALIHRFNEAKIKGSNEVAIWGDGTPLREFLHVDDLARACLLLITSFDDAVAINIGSGDEITIENLAKLISRVVGFSGEITFNHSYSNGTPRKLLDSSRISKLGWKPQISLEDGIALTYDWFLNQQDKRAVQ